MSVEHFGLLVPAPVSMGRWYQQHLGFEILRSLGTDEEGAVFLKDGESGTVLEFGRLPGHPVADFGGFDDLQVHIAIACPDPAALAQRLEKAGARLIGEPPRAEAANERLLMKDPWNVTLQLINRKNRL
jgi:hypothetical protein